MSKTHNHRFRPSWIDGFSTWIEKLPGPSWATFLGIGLILLILQVGVLWGEAGTAVSPDKMQLFFSAAIAFILGVIPYFSLRAASALTAISAIFVGTEDEREHLDYRLRHLPAVPTIAAGCLALIYILSMETISGDAFQLKSLIEYPLAAGITRGMYLLCWWCFATLIYHTFYQLRMINHILTNHTMIDLFRMRSIYAFSNLAALKAVCLIIPPLGFLYLLPDISLRDPLVLGFYLFITSVGFITFLLPQLGIHQLQRQEKDRLLDDVGQRYTTLLKEMNEKVDQKKYQDVSVISSTIDSLVREIEAIEKISTWPWKPETFRWLITAMILPLLVWIAQYFLDLWLSP